MKFTTNYKFPFTHFATTLTLVSTLIATSGCSSLYYKTMEKAGYHKRDLLRSRVEAAQVSQNDAKKQFESALARYASVVNYDGGDLREKYDVLKNELAASENEASRLHDRINAIEEVADALFEEWEDELDTYSNARLRASSKEKLTATEKRYAPMIRAMRRAEDSMKPVLTTFRDQVLYLKHNLNARALSELKGEVQTIETDVAELLAEMEKSIRASEKFLETYNSNG